MTQAMASLAAESRPTRSTRPSAQLLPTTVHTSSSVTVFTKLSRRISRLTARETEDRLDQKVLFSAYGFDHASISFDSILVRGGTRRSADCKPTFGPLPEEDAIHKTRRRRKSSAVSRAARRREIADQQRNATEDK